MEYTYQLRNLVFFIIILHYTAVYRARRRLWANKEMDRLTSYGKLSKAFLYDRYKPREVGFDTEVQS